MTNLPIENPVAETVQEPPGPSAAIVDLLPPLDQLEAELAGDADQ